MFPKNSDSWKGPDLAGLPAGRAGKTRAKAEILAGTGTGDPYVIPGVALQDELAQLVEAGLTPRDALGNRHPGSGSGSLKWKKTWVPSKKESWRIWCCWTRILSTISATCARSGESSRGGDITPAKILTRYYITNDLALDH